MTAEAEQQQLLPLQHDKLTGRRGSYLDAEKPLGSAQTLGGGGGDAPPDSELPNCLVVLA